MFVFFMQNLTDEHDVCDVGILVSKATVIIILFVKYDLLLCSRGGKSIGPRNHWSQKIF